MRSAHPGLEQSEESFDCLRVRVTVHVHLRRMVDAAVLLVPKAVQGVVSGPVVRVDHRGGQHELPERSTSVHRGTRLSDDRDPDAPSALHGPEDDRARLGRRATRRDASPDASAALGLTDAATDERLIGFDLTRKLLAVALVHELVPNFVEHPPRGLVRHPKLPFQVLGGDPASSAGDEVHGVEPKVQGRGGPLEDRPDQRMDAEAARLAKPRRTPLRRLVSLEDPLALAARALGVFAVRRVALAPDMRQARLVVRELSHELHEGHGRFRGGSASRVTAVNLGHSSLLVGKSASRGATCGAFALSKPNVTESVGRCGASKAALQTFPRPRCQRALEPGCLSERMSGRRCSKPLPLEHGQRLDSPAGASLLGRVRALSECSWPISRLSLKGIVATDCY
jgi:hypothetical protein